MNDDILSRTELAERSGASEADLERWTQAKLLKPAGFADEAFPLYSAEDLGRVAHILKLGELGYGLEEIQRIVKKFGVPRGSQKARKGPAADKFLTVGQLAERTGLSARTIKHWEEVGIIEPDMRTGGGFRLYSEGYAFLCKLIRDLQLFGYALEEIKDIAGYFRDFLALQADIGAFPAESAGPKLETMLAAAEALRAKMVLLREGIERWDDLIKKKKKEIVALQAKIAKRAAPPKEKPHA